jgi:hypothetical protein
LKFSVHTSHNCCESQLRLYCWLYNTEHVSLHSSHWVRPYDKLCTRVYTVLWVYENSHQFQQSVREFIVLNHLSTSQIHSRPHQNTTLLFREYRLFSLGSGQLTRLVDLVAWMNDF